MMRIDNLKGTALNFSVSKTLTKRISIHTPAYLHIRNGKSISYGANQLWYPFRRGRRAGCGPTTTSNLIWYLAASRPKKCEKLFSRNGSNCTEMVQLMKSMWSYVKPGIHGVDKSSILACGAIRYGEERGIKLKSHILEVPKTVSERPSANEVLNFLTTAFLNDLPIAFLNLCNGTVKDLQSWHWVILVSTNSAL